MRNSKLLIIPLVVLLSACSTTNTKWESLKDPNCRWCLKDHRCNVKKCPNRKNDIKWATENTNFFVVGKVKKA